MADKKKLPPFMDKDKDAKGGGKGAKKKASKKDDKKR